MQALVGLIILALLVGTAAGGMAHVYNHARDRGVLPLPKVPRPARSPDGKRVPARVRTKQARAQAVRGGRTVRIIAAEAIATDWLARKKHQREQAATNPQPAKQRRPLLDRLVNPGGGGIPAPASTNGTQGHTPGGPTMTEPHTWDGKGTADRDGALSGPQLRQPTQGGSVTHTTSTGTSSAGDFLSATSRVIAEAEAGGIQSKARGGLVMGEGLRHLAAAMEQHARHLQETGEYPAYVWEPWRQGAAMAHAAASKVTEAGNAAAELARRPMGEANGQAPHRDELNKR